MQRANYCKFRMRNGEEIVGYKVRARRENFAKIITEHGEIVTVAEQDIVSRQMIIVGELEAFKMSVFAERFSQTDIENGVTDEKLLEAWKFLFGKDEILGLEECEKKINTVFNRYGYNVLFDSAPRNNIVIDGVGLVATTPMRDELRKAVCKGKMMGWSMIQISDSPEIQRLMMEQANREFRLQYITKTADNSFQNYYLEGSNIVHYIGIVRKLVLTERGIRWFKRGIRDMIRVVR